MKMYLRYCIFQNYLSATVCLILVIPNNVSTSIMGTPINDEVFKVRLTLQRYRANGLVDELRLAAEQCDNAYPCPAKVVEHRTRQSLALLDA